MDQDKELCCNVQSRKTQLPSFDLREEEIKKIGAELNKSSPPPGILQISGPPGSGKVSFAEKLAVCVFEKRTVRAVKVHDKMSYQDVFRTIAEEFQLVSERYEHIPSFGDFLSELSHIKPDPEMVLMLSSLGNLKKEVQSKLMELLQGIVQTLHSITIIITTRSLWEFPRLNPNMFYQHVMQPVAFEEAKKYVLLHMNDNFYWSYELNEVVSSCRGLPRVLDQVCTELRGGVRPSVIRDKVKESPLLLLPTNECKLSNSKYEKQIGQSGRELRAMLEVKGRFGVEAYAAITGKCKSLAKFDMRHEYANHILSSDDEGQTFFIDGVVQYMLQQKYGHLREQTPSLNRFCEFYAKLLKELTPLLHSDHHTYLPSLLSQLSTMKNLLSKAVYSVGEDYTLFLDLGNMSQDIIFDYLQKMEVVEFYERCVSAARARDDHRFLAQMLISFSHAVMTLTNNFVKVGGFLAEASALFDKIGERDTLDYVRLLAAQGWQQKKYGKHQRALRYYQSARVMLERIITGEECMKPGFHDPLYVLEKARSRDKAGVHLWVLSGIICNMGKNKVGTGNIQEAVKFHQENLTLQTRMWGELHPHTALTNHCLGVAYLLSGNKSKACKYVTRGLNLRKQLVNGASLTAVHSLSILAILNLTEKGDSKLGLRMLEEAMEMRRELGPEHPDTALILNGFGTVYRSRGNHDLACEYYRQAAELRFSAFGAGSDCCTGESLDMLGDEYLALDKHQKALATQERCLQIRLQYLTENAEVDHPSKQELSVEHVWTSCRKIREIYEAMKDYGNAALWVRICNGTLSDIPCRFFPNQKEGLVSLR